MLDTHKFQNVMPLSLSISQFQEFRFLRKWANRQNMMQPLEDNIRVDENRKDLIEADSNNKGYFETYREGGNPFDKGLGEEEDESEDVFSANGVCLSRV